MGKCEIMSIDWSQLKKMEPLEPTPIEGRTPDRDVICYCELACRSIVIKAGEHGCELCCKEQEWQDFTPENVNKLFDWLDKELCALQTELRDLREATKNDDAWIDNV